MFQKMKTFAAAHETAVTATVSVVVAAAVGYAVMKFDNSDTTDNTPTED